MAPRSSVGVVEVVDIILVSVSNEEKNINDQLVDDIICITGKRELALMESSMAIYIVLFEQKSIG